MNSIESESQVSKSRNPVIDLEAEDISPPTDTGDTEPQQQAEEPAPSPPPEPERQLSFWSRHRAAIIAAVVAVLLGAWFYRAVVSDLWPPSSMAERLSTLEAANRTVNDQLKALGGNLDTLKADLAKRAEDGTNAAASVETRLGDLDKAVAELRQSIAALGQNTGGGGTADPEALTALTERVTKLEQAVTTLREGGGGTTTTTTTTGGGQDFAQLTQALADLKAKFAGGLPFKDDLDRIAVYVPGNQDLAALQPYAATGIVNPQGLATALEALLPGLAKPGAGETSGEASGFWAWFGTVVKIRDLNTLDWADLARAAANDAKAGDLNAAIARLEEPGGDLPPELSQWRDQARQRLKAESAMAQLGAAVTAVISGTP
ncbi:COG4223 family protein [Aestuariivirga sp. YIM B02566]|uniref:Uncharacterized protein n=1 Tax=Taklimakanibacter albus TaxID=2800327 RepID=A0ACC5R975_9HYPH|nr:hypothetical protein [Aestuariivirga sp. YIM B02566]MBK1869184.1 hypothetical protein [Aestuariivirga sp. YIM B02566]